VLRVFPAPHLPVPAPSSVERRARKDSDVVGGHLVLEGLQAFEECPALGRGQRFERLPPGGGALREPGVARRRSVSPPAALRRPGGQLPTIKLTVARATSSRSASSR
jgi:hypothetical protein